LRNWSVATTLSNHPLLHPHCRALRHFHRPPDQLGPEHIRQFQAAMFTQWKLAPNTVSQQLAALRFFYTRVLKQGWSAVETSYPKKVLHLPQVLSQEDVARLIDAAQTPVSR
jgi:integrase/recombinase XerD